MEKHQVLLHMTPHDTIVAALTMEAVVDIHDRTGSPVYEPLVFARVCDIADEYKWHDEVTPIEFMRMLSILEAARHVRRVRCLEPRVGGLAPHVAPTSEGRRDCLSSRPKLREVLRCQE